METKSNSKKSAASRKQVPEMTLLRAIEMVVEVVGRRDTADTIRRKRNGTMRIEE